MRYWLMCGFVVVCSICLAATEIPFESAKIGDWVEMKTTSSIQGKITEQLRREEVIEKTPSAVTVRTVTTRDNEELPPRDVVTPIVQGATPPGQNTSTLLEQYPEVVQVGNSSFTCTRTKYQVTTNAMGKPATITTTTWSSPEIPIHHRAKMIVEQQFGKSIVVITEEVIGFGHGN